MKLLDVFALIISLIIGICGYFGSNSLIFALAVVVIYFLVYMVVLRKRVFTYLKNVRKVHSCYNFINSFILTMSAKKSLEDAYYNATKLNDKEFRDVVANIEESEITEQIHYLKKYFKLALYRIFLNVFNVYQEQGGEILKISESLTKESVRVERSLRESKRIGERKLIEFSLMWVITFGILIFMRFGLSTFYGDMMKVPLFYVFLVAFFLFSLGSSVIFTFRFTNLAIKEDYEDD